MHELLDMFLTKWQIYMVEETISCTAISVYICIFTLNSVSLVENYANCQFLFMTHIHVYVLNLNFISSGMRIS